MRLLEEEGADVGRVLERLQQSQAEGALFRVEKRAAGGG